MLPFENLNIVTSSAPHIGSAQICARYFSHGRDPCQILLYYIIRSRRATTLAAPSNGSTCRDKYIHTFWHENNQFRSQLPSWSWNNVSVNPLNSRITLVIDTYCTRLQCISHRVLRHNHWLNYCSTCVCVLNVNPIHFKFNYCSGFFFVCENSNIARFAHTTTLTKAWHLTPNVLDWMLM